MSSRTGITTTQGDEMESDRKLAIRGVAEEKPRDLLSSSSTEPSEQEYSDGSVQKSSPAALEDECKILSDERINQSASSRQIGKWKVQLEKSMVEDKRRRKESAKKLQDIDRQIMDLRGLANQIMYR